MEDKNKIRLNKAIALCGITSRRKADELIKTGKVKVNNKIVLDLNCKVSPSDKIQVNDSIVEYKKKRYLLFYKPRGYITSVNDELNRETIFELLPTFFKDLKPAGRLDRDSEGLLFLTNDGYLINQIIHPKNKIKKTYLVKINSLFMDSEIEQIKKSLLSGIKIEGRIYNVDFIRRISHEISQKRKQTIFEVVIHEGINRQIRRMFQIIGYSLAGLKRIKIGPFNLGNLQKGQYLELSKEKVYAALHLQTKDTRSKDRSS